MPPSQECTLIDDDDAEIPGVDIVELPGVDVAEQDMEGSCPTSC